MDADPQQHTGAVIGISVFTLTCSLILQFVILPFQWWSSPETRSAKISNTQELQYEISEGDLTEGKHGIVKVQLKDFGISGLGFSRSNDDETSLHIIGRDKIDYEVTPTNLGRDSKFLKVNLVNPADPKAEPQTANLELPIFVSPTVFHRVWLTLLIWLPFASSVFGVYSWVRSRREKEKAQREKIADAETKLEGATDKARPAWTLAQAKLEAYFDRNLLQVNQVFVVAIAVMIVGFGFVLFGVAISFSESKVLPISYVASGAGIITQFIGATFMVIYKSTMAQANEFMSVLERINTVGMSIQVLDTMPDKDLELKNDSRARIVELLLLTNVRSKSTGEKRAEGKASPKRK
jgi:hypothetical protein